MAAAVINAYKVEDSFFHSRFVINATFTDTQASATSIVDASALAFADAAASFHELILDSIEWVSSDADGIITVLFDATADQTAFVAPGLNGKLHGVLLSPNKAGSGFTGDIRLTTSGMSNPSAFTLTLNLRKGEGFVSVPVATSADITNVAKTEFLTGDVMTASIQFSHVVNVVGTPVLEVEFDGHTYEMAYAGLQGDVASLDFSLTITDTHQAELTEVQFGDIILRGASRITGGFAQRPARLTGFTSNLADIEVNPEEEE